MFVEGASPSTHIRSRFPLHPSLSAVDGASIEGEGEEPSLPLPRLRVRWEVTEIRLQDLRFAGEETEAFLHRTLGFAVSAESAQALERRTEGWAAGLQMAALSLRGRARTQGADATALDFVAFDGGHHYIIDYLAAEVMRQQPAEVCAFLRQTAILDRFNASLCDAVTGRCDSQAMLAHLEKANLFLIPLDDQRQWYRYHHLFADFLRAESAEQEQRALHRQASQWYEAHGLTSEAIKHALAGRHQASAVRLIRSNVDETLRNGGFTAVLNWVNALPEEVVRAHKATILLLSAILRPIQININTMLAQREGGIGVGVTNLHPAEEITAAIF